MPVRPLSDRVIVKPEEPEAKMGSIHIPDSARANNLRGKVIAVGPGTESNGNGSVDGRMPLTVKVGDTIMYGWGGNPIKYDGEEYLCLRESDIMCIVE